MKRGMLVENKVLEPITVKCIDCGEEFVVSPANQKFFLSKGYEIPKRCKNCCAKKKEIKSFVCVDCGKEFQLSRTDIRYFERHNLEVPRRCESCREFKRKRNEDNK